MSPRTPPTRPTHSPVEHHFPPWGVDVFESHHADDWRMEPVRHDFLKVVFVLRGRGAYRVNGREPVECEQGDLISVPIGQDHWFEDRPGSPMSLYVVSIQPHLLQVADLDARLLATGRVELDSSASTRMEGTIRRLLFEQTFSGPATGARVLSLALRLLTELVQTDSSELSAHDILPSKARSHQVDSATRMQAYVDDLQGHFFEATNLDAAAQSLGISRRRFTQLFRQVTGSSWLAYVRRLRVDHAKHLLAQTDRTVLSIAFECGFEDLSTFYRAFKREVRQSPNQWRSAAHGQSPSEAAIEG